MYPSAKAIKKFREKVQHLTDAKQGLNLLATLNKLQRLVVGWGVGQEASDWSDGQSLLSETGGDWCRDHHAGREVWIPFVAAQPQHMGELGYQGREGCPNTVAAQQT